MQQKSSCILFYRQIFKYNFNIVYKLIPATTAKLHWFVGYVFTTFRFFFITFAQNRQAAIQNIDNLNVCFLYCDEVLLISTI